MFGSTPTTTSSFGSFGSGSTGSAFGTTAANTATNAGLFGGSSFGGGFGLSQPANTATQQQQQQPTTLFAGHDTNPYGAGSFGAGLIEKQIQTTLTLPVPSSGASQPSSLFSTPSPATTRSRDDRPVKPIATAAGLRFHTVAAKPSVLSVDKSSENASVTSFASSKFKSLATKQLTIATPPPKLHRPTDKPQVIPEAITLSFTIAKPDSTTRTIRWTGDADTTFDAVWPVVASQVKPAKLVRWRLSDGSRLDLHATVGSVDASAPIEVDVVDPADTSSSSDASAPSTTGLSFDSFYEKEKEKEEACRAINPLAPVLTKEGYYTLPDYASLCTMSTAELKAVDHFVVGCKGMGCVQWYGSTDVTGLNLDELVLFAPKEVIVYPNEDVKHPLGEGLNKPALVELLHIYPPSDPTRRAQYVNRVKTRTDHMDATFVDYQPEAGVWKFKVEHFSRYGFDDDEAHDNPQATASGSSALQTMASQLKLNPARLHQLHALYLANQPPTDVLSSSEAKDKPSIFGTLDSASTEVVSQTRLTVVEPAAPTPPAPSVPKRYAVPTLTCSTKSTVLALWNGPSTSTMDMGISMGRSFRGASFGPSGQLVVVTRHRQVRVHQHPLPSPATADSLPLLHVHQALSTTNAHTHHVELPTNMAAHIHEYADMAVSALPMWQLVLALFGLEHREGSTTPHPLSPSQRDEFISRWFELATRRSKSAADNTVLQALLQHNIVDAAERAMAQGNFRLAMVVAQAQSYESSTFRMQLQAQLSQWETQSASRHVDKELLEIYSLLAGSVGVVTQPATANSSMDWIQMLALVLWYHEGPTSLPRALAVYQSYVQQGWCKPAVNAAMKPDVLMELMQLYCDVKTSLTSVLSALPDDIAWHLNAVLCAVPGLSLRLSTKANAVLTRHYLSHLVADRNLLAQALYVAMTMPDDVEREATAKAILQRHITASTPRTPLEALVPSPWIEDALALYALAEQQYDAAVEHYLRAGAWTAAHDVLIHHVVFPAMIHQDTTWVHLVLEAHLAPRAQDIAQWAAYGNVVLTYLNLRRTRDNATMESVVALCDRLHQWQTKPLHVLSDNAIEASAVARACLSSMLAYTTEVAVLLQPSGPGSSSARHWFDRLQTFVQPDAFGESFRAALLVRACAAFD
ncbi:hypothetical protein DYB32_009455 [Aphanomyces invadans]|uniref:Peptidase S59 domain-containing protein n=1 Tax=Aphanomyces invadans TaxID=157072 RepID=A0A3R6VKH3_9STRA|nr:hypothetical protein DYB32_009455 [Aphanomyces invadans]